MENKVPLESLELVEKEEAQVSVELKVLLVFVV